MKSKRVRIADLAKESFVLFHREGYPGVFDTTAAMCQKAGFCPRIENPAEYVADGAVAG